MDIKNEKYYAIVKFDGKKIVDIFNNRVYLGKFVKSAYSQTPNKDEYVICQVKCTQLTIE